MSTRPEMRVSDRERQVAADRLRAAHDEGRLDFSEYDHRLGLAYQAVTYRDLDQLFADLPATPSPPVPAYGAARPPTVVPDGRGAFARLPLALKILWVNYAVVVAINVTVWLLVSVTNAEAIYFWPIWLLVPGAVLFGVTATVQAARRRRY